MSSNSNRPGPGNLVRIGMDELKRLQTQEHEVLRLRARNKALERAFAVVREIERSRGIEIDDVLRPLAGTGTGNAGGAT